MLDLLLPRACANCDARATAPLCTACEATIVWITDPICDRCGAPIDGRCTECPFSFRRARAAALYEGAAREALKAFKLAGERRSARALANAMVPAARHLHANVITFVPSDGRIEAERGFNPAQELARPVGRMVGLRVVRLLEKVRRTPDLASLGGAERRAALHGAFESKPVAGEVLLVDDIMTTGATAEACAKALMRAGATAVDVLSFARSIRRRPRG